MSGRTAIAGLLGNDSAARRRLVKPTVMVVLAFSFGAGLLGLAGWFIAASAVAGLSAASAFSFVFPSAEVQALAWARTLTRYGERITTHGATLDLVGSLRTRLFARASRLPRDRVAELRSSELLGRIMVDSDAVENLLLRSWFPILAVVAALVETATMFALLSYALALVAIAGIVLTGGITALVARHHAGRPARTLVAARAGARRTLIEALDGLPELRSFGAEQRAADAVRADLERLAESRRQMTRVHDGGRSVGILLGDLTLLMVVATAAGALGTAALSAPALVAVCLVAIAAFESVVALPAAITARARARAAGARLTEVFSEGSARPVRNDENDLVPAPGESVLITGASGTGKSTMLRAIGQDRGTTLVAQDAHVFGGTIRDNLLLADPGATESQLWAALSAAALDDTVASFPAGLDTQVGAGGSALSGGQRRRLSVAQGLLRRPDVLLLDEPTEGVDTPTAARLLAGVRAFNPGAGLVIALHDRQSPGLPWSPSKHIDLMPGANIGRARTYAG